MKIVKARPVKETSDVDQDAEIRRLDVAGKSYREIAKATGATFYRVQKVLSAGDVAPAGTQPTLPLARILVGPRIRKNKGDIAGMARSINQEGLLHPIVVSRLAEPQGDCTHELICGERRLLGWQLSQFRDQEIPVHIVAVEDKVRAEEVENRERKDFTPSEIYELKIYWEAKLRPAALERRNAGKPVDPAEAHGVGQRVGEIAGKSRPTVEKISAVMEAALEDPERYGRLAEQMERTGKADGPFKRLQIMRQTEAIKNAPATLPSRGPYSVGVIDFPWPHEPGMSQEDIDQAGRSLRPYAAMAISAGMVFMREKIAPLLAVDDGVVLFWTTNFHMPFAFVLLKELGFPVHSTIGTWIKARMGRGQILRDKTEHCIIAKRGKPLINLTNQTTEWSGWKQPTKNSRKPDEFYRMVEELCPAERYADIFSFGNRGDKWDCFGDQAERMAASATSKAALDEAERERFPGISGDNPALAAMAGGAE